MSTIKRTYPQPDSPRPNIGPRERALAVFKYLLDLEPEAAVKHPLFACIVHSYEQQNRSEFNRWASEEGEIHPLPPSLVAELTSERPVDLQVRFFGNLEPRQPEKL